MRPPSLAFLVLSCFLFLGGCAAKNDFRPPAAPFPESPAGKLAKTPAQGASGENRKNSASASGGWGYKQADAFVLSPPPGHRGTSYNTIPLEKRLIHARNDVEFSDTPTGGQRYAVLDYGTVSRTISTKGNRMYAVWRGRVCLLSEAESPGLYLEAASCPLPRRATLAASANTRSVDREYWFDISETFNRKSGAKGQAQAAAWQKPW